jgi:hypothetical protein
MLDFFLIGVYKSVVVYDLYHLYPRIFFNLFHIAIYYYVYIFSSSINLFHSLTDDSVLVLFTTP